MRSRTRGQHLINASHNNGSDAEPSVAYLTRARACTITGPTADWLKIRCRRAGKVTWPLAGSQHMSNQTTVMRAAWNGVVVAESDDTVIVEGNHYFPRESLREEFFEPSDYRSVCPWKGQAQYLTLVVNDKQNKDSGWYYPAPKPAAAEISGRVAFWRGVSVTAVDSPDDGGDDASRG